MNATILPFTRPVVEMPRAPRTLAEAGLSFDLVLQLVLKTLHFGGDLTGSELSRRLGVQHSVLEPVLAHLKQTHLVEYRLQGRGGKGIIDIKTGGRNGYVVGMLQVREGDDILVVTTKGKIIRVHANEVTSQGRNTMGVRIIDLDPEDQVGNLARVDAEQVTPEPTEAESP